MARVNVSIPDEIVVAAKAAGLNVSRLAAAALVEELERLEKMDALDRYLASLDEQLGPVSDSELSSAAAWADVVFGAVSSSERQRRQTA